MNEQTNTPSTRASTKANGKWSSAQETATEIRDKAMGAAKGVVSDVRERAGTYFEDFNASPTAFIRGNPIVSAIGGIFVGFLLGAAVSRRTLKK